MKVFLVTGGGTDYYGIFSTRELAEDWIKRQSLLGWEKSWFGIDEFTLDSVPDMDKL